MLHALGLLREAPAAGLADKSVSGFLPPQPPGPLLQQQQQLPQPSHPAPQWRHTVDGSSQPAMNAHPAEHRLSWASEGVSVLSDDDWGEACGCSR